MGFDYDKVMEAIKVGIRMFGIDDKIQAFLLAMIDKAKPVIDADGDIVEDIAEALVKAILEELGIEPK